MEKTKILEQFYQISHIPYGLLEENILVSYEPKLDITAQLIQKLGEGAYAGDCPFEMKEIPNETYYARLFLQPHCSEKHSVLVLGPVNALPVSHQSSHLFLRSVGLPGKLANEYARLQHMTSSRSISHLARAASFLFNILGEGDTSYMDFVKNVSRYNSQIFRDYRTEDIYHGNQEFSSQMYSLIQYGKKEELARFLTMPHDYGNAAMLSKNQSRHTKYMLIHSATIAEQYAIRGGLPYEKALSVMERYIQKFEKTEDMNIQAQLHSSMLLEFAELVGETNTGMAKTMLVRKASEHIHTHLEEKLTVEQIAKILQISPSYLSSAFKKETGLGLKEYINKRKIQEAMRRLRTSDAAVIEISEALSYPSQAYFSSVFKKVTGVTPTRFRNDKGDS